MRAKARKTTRTRPVTAEPATELAAELATTLATLTLFHSAVQHADDKARTAVAIQTMLTGMVAAQLTFLVEPGAARSAQLVILAVFVPGYLQSSCHLLRALIPRTAPTSGHNQFAFPSVANDLGPIRVSVPEQCTQAHEVGRVLANIAMVKHHHIRRAMYGTCALFASARCTVGSAAPTSAANSGCVRGTPISPPSTPYVPASSTSTRASRTCTSWLPKSIRRRVAQREHGHP